MAVLPSSVDSDIHTVASWNASNGEHGQSTDSTGLGFINSDKKSNITCPPKLKSSYHDRRQKRRKLSAYRKLTTYGSARNTAGLSAAKKSSHKTKSSKLRQSTGNGVVDLTLSGTTRHDSTYKIRFMHNKGCVGRLKKESQSADDANNNICQNAEQRTDDKETQPHCPVKSSANPACSNADDKMPDNGGPPETDNNNVTQNKETKTSQLETANYLPSLTGMTGISISNTFTDKIINPVGKSRTSSWVLVGPHGHHQLRPPTPIPTERQTFNILPPICQESNKSPYDWALKSKKVTLSALLQVDHKQACIRDESFSFEKELFGALQSRLKSLASDEHEVEAENEPLQEQHAVDLKHHSRILPPLHIPSISPGKSAKKQRKEICSDFKERSLRRNYSRSTLPDVLPKLVKNHDKDQLPDENAVTSATKSDDDTQYLCSTMKYESGLSNSCVSISADTEDEENTTICSSPVVIIRSESENRQMLADTMGFECQTEDLDSTFMDDKTLQRAVILRNLAYHPQAPPSSPEHDAGDERSSIFEETATHRIESNNQGSEGVLNESHECHYWKPTDTSPGDHMKPTLQEITSLLDVHEDMFLHGTDGKHIKSVRFAELPPKHKRLTKSKSDPTTNNKMTSAEWNKCFLVAIGENRAIKKEFKHTRRNATSSYHLPDDGEDHDDDLGTELIEREMKRYIHWLRHDRASEQRRWLSTHVSQKNVPIATHHIEPVNPVKPKLSATSLSARVAKAIGLYCVLPKTEQQVAGRPVKFPRVPVLPPIAGGSNETFHSRSFKGEVKGMPMVSKQYKKKKRFSNGRRY